MKSCSNLGCYPRRWARKAGTVVYPQGLHSPFIEIPRSKDELTRQRWSHPLRRGALGSNGRSRETPLISPRAPTVRTQ
nr:MAG: 8.8 kDa protein [Plant tombusvirus-like associated RNA 1]